jgi:hypothetical protein
MSIFAAPIGTSGVASFARAADGSVAKATHATKKTNAKRET